MLFYLISVVIWVVLLCFTFQNNREQLCEYLRMDLGVCPSDRDIIKALFVIAFIPGIRALCWWALLQS